MKFSEHWLRTFVDPPLATRALADALAMGGLDVESVEGVAPAFSGVVVGEVLAVDKHPAADRLTVCRVNVGVAVAARDALVVPTVFDADTKSLGQIAREMRALAERVRSGAVTPPELSGGTFTVSNLGMYGMRRITPVINPPQAAILGVGSVEERAVVRGGEIVARRMMDLTLVCDHRILYGADAAQFLAHVKELLEHPLRLSL